MNIVIKLVLILTAINSTVKGEEDTWIHGVSHFEVSEILQGSFKKPVIINIKILGIEELKAINLEIEKTLF